MAMRCLVVCLLSLGAVVLIRRYRKSKRKFIFRSIWVSLVIFDSPSSTECTGVRALGFVFALRFFVRWHWTSYGVALARSRIRTFVWIAKNERPNRGGECACVPMHRFTLRCAKLTDRAIASAVISPKWTIALELKFLLHVMLLVTGCLMVWAIVRYNLTSSRSDVCASVCQAAKQPKKTADRVKRLTHWKIMISFR